MVKYSPFTRSLFIDFIISMIVKINIISQSILFLFLVIFLLLIIVLHTHYIFYLLPMCGCSLVVSFALLITKEKVSCLHEHIEISAIYTVSLMMAGDPLKCCPVPVFRPPFQSVPTVGSNFQERQGWVGRGDLSQDSYFQQ